MSEFIGALGEVFAARYLRDRGYKIVCANFRTRMGEIDIAAEKDGVLAFIEVKTRSAGMIAPPAESVDAHKQKRIAMAAAVLSTAMESPTLIHGASCVSKSYPGFWEDLERAGMKTHPQPLP